MHNSQSIAKTSTASITKYTVQASSNVPGNVKAVQALTKHPAFHISNPNNCYSLFLAFVMSPVNFHAEDGSGYAFMVDSILSVSTQSRLSQAVIQGRLTGLCRCSKRYGICAVCIWNEHTVDPGSAIMRHGRLHPLSEHPEQSGLGCWSSGHVAVEHDPASSDYRAHDHGSQVAAFMRTSCNTFVHLFVHPKLVSGVQVDKINHQVAARMVSPFTQYAQYDQKRQGRMAKEVKRLLAAKDISENVYEVASKSLAQ